MARCYASSTDPIDQDYIRFPMISASTAHPEHDTVAHPWRDRARRAAYGAKTIVAKYPTVALPVARWRGHGVVLDGHTDVLIEGFPRSANNFAVAAFLQAQPSPLRVAHHVHAPAHVLAALRKGLPALVLVREPEEAVLEFVIRNPYLSFRQALRGYARFYRPLLPHRDGLVVGVFREVTTDFGLVIRRMNERFGTRFAEFEHTEQNVRACFEEIEAHYRHVWGSSPLLERIVARPSAARDALKDELRAGYGDPALARDRQEAERLFDVFRRPRPR
jgi:hypothetical protein